MSRQLTGYLSVSLPRTTKTTPSDEKLTEISKTNANETYKNTRTMPFIKGASETTSLILQLYKATSIERSHG